MAEILAGAEFVVTSDLTLVECDRILLRSHVLRRLTEARHADLRSLLNRTVARWSVLRLDRDIIERARRPFPGEPIRTLDALHLATALTTRARAGARALLSLDQRIRAAGRELGFELLPA